MEREIYLYGADAEKLLGFGIDDLVVLKVTGKVSSLSKVSVCVQITECEVENDASTVPEAARRAQNEMGYVKTQIQPNIG